MQAVAGIAVAGDHHLTGTHHTARRLQQMPLAIALPVLHRRGAVQHGTAPLRGTSETADIAHGMERKAFFIEQGAIGLAADQVVAFKFLLADDSGLDLKFFAQEAAVGLQALDPARMMGEFEATHRCRLGFEAFTGEEVMGEADGVAALSETSPRFIEAPAFDPAFHAGLADADRGEAAIATATAPTDPVGFQAMGPEA